MREYSDIYYLISYQKFFLHLMISLEGYYLKNRKRVYIELNSNNIIIIISLIYIIAFMMKVSKLVLEISILYDDSNQFTGSTRWIFVSRSRRIS